MQICASGELIENGFNPIYVERWSTEGENARKKKAASKTRYTCPDCGANAWAKPEVHLVCGACDERMEAEE